MVERPAARKRVETALERSRVAAVIGPRQCGKTTLVQNFLAPEAKGYFDLEDPEQLELLNEAKTTLAQLKGLVVIDEVQRRPELFPLLRVLADRKPLPAKFLILGSASPELLRQTSESLAGRIEYVELTGFSLSEVGADQMETHWLRGGFPLAYLARSEADSFAWRKCFIADFLQRDLPGLGISIPPVTMNRFWSMLAHYHGQVWNASEIAGAMGITSVTVKRYLDILTGTFMVRQLQPWHENLGKRQVKAPKIYFRDSGIYHNMLGIRTEADLFRHPKLGASWEGYALEEAIRFFEPDEVYFWATHAGAELDLLLFKDGRRIGVEFKRADGPKLTPSMKTAMTDLKLDELHIVYPGSRDYTLAEGVSLLPIAALASQRLA